MARITLIPVDVNVRISRGEPMSLADTPEYHGNLRVAANDTALADNNWFGRVDLAPGAICVIRGGPVIRAVPSTRNRVEVSAIEDDEPSYIDVPESGWADDRTAIERIVAILHNSWHPVTDDHARTDDRYDTSATVAHDGYPPHWHGYDGAVKWFTCLDDGPGRERNPAYVLGDAGLCVDTPQP